MGRASLLTKSPGSVDVIPPGSRLRNGLTFGDPIETANALEEWFGDAEEVLSEGQRFYEFLKSSSDPSTIASKYKEIYRQIIAGHA
jgi:hypothetical protein